MHFTLKSIHMHLKNSCTEGALTCGEQHKRCKESAYTKHFHKVAKCAMANASSQCARSTKAEFLQSLSM